MSDAVDAKATPVRKALVTGGAGFLGAAIVKQLLEQGTEVTIASRSAAESKHDSRVRAISLDLTDAAALAAAAEGVDTIFHVAALAGVWGPRQAYFDVNVTGTRNVIAAALANGVSRLVHTSSPSVCFDGQDHANAGNDLPYAEKFLCAYSETKLMSEREVLAANGNLSRSGLPLATCAMRPHLIMGPDDPHILPRLIERSRAGRLAIIGDGVNEVSLTDVENAAHAQLCAAKHLAPESACAGRAYFIGQEESVVIWEWLAELFRQIGVPAPTRQLSRRTAYSLGAVCEAIWKVLPLSGEPPMTRFVALQLSSTHTYDLTSAKADFGYREQVSLREMTERIVRQFAS